MKKIAKQRLVGVYFYSVIVWLVYEFISDQAGVYRTEYNGVGFSVPTISTFLPHTLLIAAIMWLFYIFIVLPLMASIQWFFLRIADEQRPSWREILEVFTKQNYTRYFVASLLITIFTGLWTLLFIVPGIIKTFSYSQTFRLMRDNPELGALDAITLSRERMNGAKAKLFSIQLSFVVWFIIPIVLLITGVTTENQALMLITNIIFTVILLFIGPYFQTTSAVFYTEQIRGKHDTIKL
ncbi:DUF975 family protein [Listeria sp. FSL L7-1582]|uniref:DUF975 family protein n=1 Tax=Listeria portnoyi TaxID=2713504 RepID=UPI00164E28A3|nr:DUF975 family protein [Listeria portnoyi]MBC6309835.1 DUF975 family protein [Listeria portnoyi]